MKWTIIWMISILACSAMVLAHVEGDTSVVVRLSNVQDGTYTFTCDIPSEAVSPRTWTIREDATGAYALPDTQTPGETLETSVLTKEDLYHIGCQTNIVVNGTWTNIRGDFHVDLRGPNDRTIIVHETEGTYIDLSCNPNEVASGTVGWEFLDAQTHETTTFSSTQRINYTVANPGLWDIECHMNGETHVLPVEFFEEGPAYVPTADGCVPEEPCYADENTGNQTNTTTNETNTNSTGNQTNTTDTNETDTGNQTCYTSVTTMPAQCSGGTLVTDSSSGTCRTLVCQTGEQSMQVLACDKPDGAPTHFEMYKQSQQGSAITSICLGETCITNNPYDGYEKSNTFPLCSEEEPTTDTNETDTNTTGNQTNTIDNETNTNTTMTCTSMLSEIPATCASGTVTYDAIQSSGCRQVICSNGGDSTTVLACNKPSNTAPTHIEVYKKAETGNGVKTCLGDACINYYGGYATTDYPVCTESDSGTGTNTTGNQTNTTDTNETETVCYENMLDIPVTCQSGSVTIDDVLGSSCRYMRCSDGSDSTTVLACNKPDNSAPTRFEMYKQETTGNGVQLCLTDTCIGNNGYDASDLPACTEQQQTTSGGQNLPPNPPAWLEPTEGKNDVNPFDLHMHVFDMVDPDGDAWVSTDFEVYEETTDTLVWSYLGATANHVHFGDGIWTTPAHNLEYNHQYYVRARYHSNSTINSTSIWSMRSFSTIANESGESSDWTWTPISGYKVELVAQDINLPVNIVDAPELYGHLPQGEQPLLYVTQLYGQIGVILKDGTYKQYANNLLNYDVFGSLPGSGEMGVTGLYVDPSTGDLFVSMVYVENSTFKGKVERFYTNANGDGYTGRSVVIDDLPVAPSHQVQDITRGPDGKLYVSMGDANDLSGAQNTSVLSGKVLRLNEDGSMPADNPFGTYVYAAGFRNPFGTAWRPGTSELYAGNNGPDSDDGIYKILGGETFGWCCNTSAGTWRHYAQTVVPTQLAFDQTDSNSLYIVLAGSTNAPGPSTRGKRIMRIQINGDGSAGTEQKMVQYTGDGYGGPNGLSFVDGELYFTDLLGENGFTGGASTEGNIYRLVPGTQTEDPAPTTHALSAAIGPAPWYPQGRNVVWECKGSGGSGSYTYDYYFGDGDKLLGVTGNVYHTYAAPGTYDVSCTVHDGSATASTSTSITLS